MKLNIVKEASKKDPIYKLKAGWSEFGDDNREYRDFERDVFTIPDPKGSGGNIYIQEIVTFHSTKSDGDYDEAYTYIRQNNPDGDHDEGTCHAISVEVAVSMCLEELLG